MIVIELSGGLGNQMFQYALYKKFESLNKDVVMETSFFRSGQELREYELGIFPVKYREITDKEAADIRGFGYQDSVLDKVYRKLKPKKYKTYIDKIGPFQPEIFDMDNVYLSGYWQNENYFKDIRENICKDFSFSEKLMEQNKDICERLERENSVSVHIRRGDYLTTENTRIHGNICTDEYYTNAMNYIKQRIENPRFYIFTDDLAWAREKYSGENITIVDGNRDTSSYVDMFLMSKCKHNIVANSTFSWWGAWLNSNSDKLVLAPPRWLNNFEEAQVACADWILIDNK